MTTFDHSLVAFLATYWIHSTLLLAAAWLLDYSGRLRKAAVAEQVWKTATVLGFVTTSMQLVLTAEFPTAGLLSTSIPFAVSRPAASSRETPTGSAITPMRASADDFETSVEPSGESKDFLFEQSAADVVREPPGPFAGSSNPERNPWTVLRHESADELPPHRVNHPSRKSSSIGGWQQWLSTILLGSLFCLPAALAVGVLRLAQLHCRFAGAERVPDGQPPRKSLDELLKRIGCRAQIQLLTASNCTEPLAYGFFHWRIVLPRQIVARIGPEELQALLAHELAHLIRRDYWWLWLGKLLCCGLPFQPLHFVARRRWQDAAEHLCDAWAVGRGVAPLSLAKCLVQIAEWHSHSRCQVALRALGSAQPNLSNRIRRLAHGEVRGRAEARFRFKVPLVVITCWGMVSFAPHVYLPVSPTTLVAAAVPATSANRTACVEWIQLDRSLRTLDQQLETLSRVTHGFREDSDESRLLVEIQESARQLRIHRDLVGKQLHPRETIVQSAEEAADRPLAPGRSR